ncbi:MAG: type II secretion system protein, partial [Chlamydiae bacterium]|nr:type II secretion system protein [Chlamydiota bacterium]
MRNKKYSFSLLEILIALSIISLLASLFSFKILDLIKDYKFKKTVEMLKEDLTR